MMRRLWWTLMLSSLLVVAAQAQPDDTFRTMEYAGLERSYHIYEPDTAPTGLLFVLHPFASNGRAMAFITGFNDIAAANDWVVVYPNSAGFYWDDGRSQVGLPPDDGPVDDLGFLRALRDQLAATYELERDAIFLSGFAQGGNMAYTVACQMPDAFGGVAVVAALMWEYQAEQCGEIETPVDLFILYGMRDPVYRPQGNEISDGAGSAWALMGVNDTFDFWRGRQDCPVDPISSGTSLVWHPGCMDGVSTAIQLLNSAQSNWPRQGAYALNPFGVDAGETIAAFFSADGSAEDDAWLDVARPDATFDGLARSYTLYVPNTYDPAVPTPLAMILHGRTTNASNQAYADDMRRIAEREGFILVYPNGIENEWDYGDGVGVYGELPQNDEVFLDTLLDDLALDLNIDPQRVYVAGLSNGGLMTQRLACTRNDRYAAFASVAATAPFGLTALCRDTGAPVPLLFVQGDADPIMPWAGVITQAAGREIYATAPMVNTLQFWADVNGCATTYAFEELPQVDEATLTQVYDFDGCRTDAALVLYGIDGGGHVWPGVRAFQSDTLGAVSMDFNASEVIWDFFSQYTLDMPADEADADDARSDDPIVLQLGPEPEPEEEFVPSDEQRANAQVLLETLREGGFVIYIHAMPFVEDFESCEAPLTTAGVAEAEAIAAAFEALAISIDEVVTAENCVWVATSRLLFGENFRTLDAFDPQVIQLLLSSPPEAGTNAVIVADGPLLQAALGLPINPGQSLIFRPLGEAGTEPITGIPVGGWALIADWLGLSADESD